MTPNPPLGVVFHWLGGLAAGSFYVPYRQVKNWAWETYWLAGGVFSWIIAPWFFALLLSNDLAATLRETPAATWGWVYLFGVLWGFGGLTFGLTMRYLGMSLGMAVVLGLCAAFGTLMPPAFAGEFAAKLWDTHSGLTILGGIGVCLAGIALAGIAGMSKEGEMSAEQKTEVIREFNFKKGLLVAIFSGVLSACFSYGLTAGGPIRDLTIAKGTPALWQGLPILVVILLGGFTTNFVWCVALNLKNRTGSQYFGGGIEPAPVARNYLFCALAGVAWYLQFFFYTMGEAQMGTYKFSSWSMQMASIIIFSSLWGIALHEWKGTSRRTRSLLAASLAVLVASTMVVGYGNYLASAPPAESARAGPRAAAEQDPYPVVGSARRSGRSTPGNPVKGPSRAD